MAVAAFRAALDRAGFAFLKQSGRFVDRHHRVPHRYLLPVTDARGRLRRRDTLAALAAWRAEYEAGLAASAAQQQQRIALAERLAPKAVPGCRADLTDAAAIAQLADDFLTRAAGFGCIEFKALIQMGWSAAQLREHGDAARAVADRKATSSQTVASNHHA
jgi:hypothetical protein